MGQNRIRFVDVTKGVAILCIVLGHMYNFYVWNLVFTFHVPIFFLITGYFLNAKRPLPVFAKTRARSLLVPYAVTCAAIVVLGTGIGLLRGNAFSAAKTWIFAALYGAGSAHAEPFAVPSIGAVWFLWAAFWGCLFVRISLKLKAGQRLLFLSILFAAAYLTRNILWLPFSIQAGAYAAMYMYLGYLFRQAEGQYLSLPAEVKAAGLLMAAWVWISFIVHFESFWLSSGDIGRGVIDIVGTLCASAVVIFLCTCIDRYVPRIARPLAWLGRYSIYVLCVHTLELHFFPWGRAGEILAAHGIGAAGQFVLIYAGKLAIILPAVFLLSKSRAAGKLFGLEK